MNYLTKIRRTSKMFSFQRFFALFKRDFMMRRKGVLIVMAIEISIVAIFMILSSLSFPNNIVVSDVFRPFYLMFIIATGVLSCVIPFKNYEKKYNRSESILLPASVEEKYIVNFIMAFIMVPIINFVALFIGLEIGHLINWLRFDKYVFLYKETFHSFTHYFSWIKICVVLGISFFGAILFKKNKLIKTWAIVFGLGFLVIIGVSVFIYMYHEAIKNGSIMFHISKEASDIIEQIFSYAVFVTCVVGAYFKLRKERS